MRYHIGEKPCEEAHAASAQIKSILEGAEHEYASDPADSDIIVSVGGDGTLFHTIGSHIHHGKPFIGVNGGTLGFRCAVKKGAFEEILDYLGCKPYSLSIFRVIWGEESELAVQDVRVERLDQRALRLRIEMAGKLLSAVHLGDGLLVANALGSTGYNLSAGGYKIPLAKEGAVVTPICPFPNPLFDSISSSIPLVGGITITPKVDARLVLDDRFYLLKAGTEVTISQEMDAYKLIARG